MYIFPQISEKNDRKTNETIDSSIIKNINILLKRINQYKSTIKSLDISYGNTFINTVLYVVNYYISNAYLMYKLYKNPSYKRFIKTLKDKIIEMHQNKSMISMQNHINTINDLMIYTQKNRIWRQYICPSCRQSGFGYHQIEYGVCIRLVDTLIKLIDKISCLGSFNYNLVNLIKKKSISGLERKFIKFDQM